MILLNLNMHSFLLLFNEDNLTIAGNKFKQNGYIKDNPKLINISFIKWIWVFLYTKQKNDK